MNRKPFNEDDYPDITGEIRGIALVALRNGEVVASSTIPRTYGGTGALTPRAIDEFARFLVHLYGTRERKRSQ